jgi:Phosphodiester glycosidase
MTNVLSRFRAIWTDGTATPFGLNEERPNDGAVLFTSALGASTHTSGGVELVLECATNDLWLPLQSGKSYQARVREVRSDGDTPLRTDSLVLSLGPKLASRLPKPQPGTVLKIVTQTIPDLSGVKTAIGGGPTLVRDGKAMQWSGIQMRHPRTAIGWNKDFIYLVEVDGRQPDLSIGMTFPELAAYMIKLGCEQAMNLDGGGSATLWVCGNVMNSPSEGQERPGANALVVVQKKEPRKAAPQK